MTRARAATSVARDRRRPSPLGNDDAGGNSARGRVGQETPCGATTTRWDIAPREIPRATHDRSLATSTIRPQPMLERRRRKWEAPSSASVPFPSAGPEESSSARTAVCTGCTPHQRSARMDGGRYQSIDKAFDGISESPTLSKVLGRCHAKMRHFPGCAIPHGTLSRSGSWSSRRERALADMYTCEPCRRPLLGSVGSCNASRYSLC